MTPLELLEAWSGVLIVLIGLFATWYFALRRSQVRKASKRLSLTAFLAFGFLYLPIIVVAIFSFNNSRFRLDWVGFTWKWYAKIFGDESVEGGLEGAQLLLATQNTLVLAVISTIIATLLGALLGYGLHRYRFLQPRAAGHREPHGPDPQHYPAPECRRCRHPHAGQRG